MHSLLLGNGINRLSKQLDWLAVLQKLADSVPGAHAIRHSERKPLSLFFEELCSVRSVSITSRQAEREIKKNISGLLIAAQPDQLLPEFTKLFSVILTTNYDHAVESSISGPLYQSANVMPESRYSLFRRTVAEKKTIWHIHGDIYHAESILLGYDHYAGYLQKIRNYQVGGLTQEQIKHLVRNMPAVSRDNPSSHNLFSWVDHFLRDHLHIVGLGLDFTEIDLWWLLVYKKRRDKKTGLTFYYWIQIAGQTLAEDVPQISLLQSLGVRLHTVNASNYREGYEKILLLIKQNMIDHPMLLDHQAGQTKEYQLAVGTPVSSGKKKDLQLSLKLPRMK
jgi:hypothetical protein